ncbi:MAG: hypothetical protein ABR575_00925 [Actinomycetota bacterium]
MDAACAATAERQHGVLGRRQAIELGLSRQSIQRRLDAGRLELLHPRTYRLAGVPDSWLQRVMAACIWAGPAWVASHRAAAALWGLDRCPPGWVEISGVGAAPSRRRGVINHTTCDLVPAHRTSRIGIPVTTPTRTLLDLGAVVDDDTLEAALVSCLRRGLTSPAYLRRHLDQLSRPGRRGCGRLARVLDSWATDAPPTQSDFETSLFQALRRAGLPLPIPQFEVFDKRGFVARPDFAYPRQRVAIEAYSYRWHAPRDAWERDVARRNALLGIGWQVIEVTTRNLRQGPGEVTRRIADAIGTTLLGSDTA